MKCNTWQIFKNQSTTEKSSTIIIATIQLWGVFPYILAFSHLQKTALTIFNIS